MASLREDLQARLSGAYKLGRELSGGGMSRVFVAEDSSLGRTVVIKVLAPELAAGLNAERFKREIMLAAQLQHPHIVPVLAAGIADELPYFVMPFVAGESMRHRLLPEVGLPITEVVSVLRDVAKALAFAHAQGVVHRDIKPDNVLLAGGSAVVTDFGIAKAISSAAVAAPGGTLTQVGTSLGTPAYMSPEQAAGDPNADSRSDFYSFGVMAYEMIAGKTPFHDRQPHALIMAHIAEPPEPIERLVPATPPPLAHLVMQCLSKNPADRPQSAKEILEALEDVDLSGQRIRSGPQTMTSGERAAAANTTRIDTGPHAYRDGTVLVEGVQPQAAARRKLSTPLIAALVIIILAIGGFAARKLMSRPSASNLDERSLAVLPFRVASADPSHAYLREGMLDLIAAKLSGEDLHSVEPRMLLDAWRQAGGTETSDLSKTQSIQLAEQLKAGKALLGDVVGTPNRLVLNVSMFSVPKGSQIAKVSVEGPPDSLASLVDQIAQQLLTQTSGEASQRMSNLTSTSLTALRAYLDGQALLRRGDAQSAAKQFDKALKEDSTFALAGLGLRLATGWYGDPALGNRGISIAWREKARLSPRDQALLVALAGPRYPYRSSNLEVYKARETYLQMVPDNAEAWYLFADQIFHFGSFMGIRDWEQRSLDGFRKAMNLDSTYLPGYQHAMPLAPSMGDTAFYNRALRLRLASDTSSMWKLQNDWYIAAHSGDMAQSAKVFDRLGSLAEPVLNGMVRETLFDGTGAQDAKTAIEKFVGLAVSEQQRGDRSGYAHDVMLDLGRPADAARYLAASRDSANDLNFPIITVRDAMMGEASMDAAIAAAKFLAPYENQPEATDSIRRDVQRAVTRVMEPWRLSRGDTSMTRRSIARLKSLTRNLGPDEQVMAEIEVAFIEMMHADVTKSPALRPTLEKLDSLMMLEDITHGSTGRWAQQTITAARLWEKVGDRQKALTMIGRYGVWNTESVPYLSIQLREQGRIAALAGDKQRAIRAYRHFIKLRAVAEPSTQRETDSAKRELARLEANGQ